jgi:putative tricarboxylic transport membrane protein
MSTTPDTAGVVPDEKPGPLLVRIAPELVALVVCVALLVSTVGMTTSAGGPGPAFYPRLLGGLLVVALLVRIGQQLRSHRRETAGHAPETAGGEPSDFDPALISDRRVWAAVAFTVAYIVATIYLGWPIGTFLFVIAFLWAAGKRNLAVTVPVAAVLAIAFTFIFVKAVYMALPTGVGVFDSLTVSTYELLGIY